MQQAIPLLRAAAPPLIIVSAGYDAHHADPLGGMVMTAQGFGHLARFVRHAAVSTPLVILLEGGYDLDGLAHSVVATLEALTGIEAHLAEASTAVRELPVAVAGARARAVRRIAGENWAHRERIADRLDAMIHGLTQSQTEMIKATEVLAKASVNLQGKLTNMKAKLAHRFELCLNGSLGFWISLGLLAGWSRVAGK